MDKSPEDKKKQTDHDRRWLLSSLFGVVITCVIATIAYETAGNRLFGSDTERSLARLAGAALGLYGSYSFARLMAYIRYRIAKKRHPEQFEGFCEEALPIERPEGSGDSAADSWTGESDSGWYSGDR